MFTRFVRRQLERFERRWQYDASYMREVLDEGGIGALLPMQTLQKLGAYRKDVSPEVHYAAGLAATRAADCGPCMQLGVRMAEAQGVSSEVLRAIVAGDRQAMSADVRLAYDLACATASRDASCTELSRQARRRWGARGLMSLAYAMVLGQSYPTIKYALGHGHACERITVGGVAMAPAALQAAR